MRTEMSTSDTEEEYDWNHFQNDWKKIDSQNSSNIKSYNAI